MGKQYMKACKPVASKSKFEMQDQQKDFHL